MECSTPGNAGSNRYTAPSPRRQRSRSGAPSLAYEYKRSCSTSGTNTSSKPSYSKQSDESNKPSKQDSSKKFSVFQSFKKNVPVHEKKEGSSMTHYHLQIPHPVSSSQQTRKARSAATSPSAWALSPGRSMLINPLKQLQEVGGRTSSHDHERDQKQGEKSIMKKMKGNAVSGVLQRLLRPMKVSAAETEALHHLRMLHTRHMQWRLVNARSDRAMALKEMSAQKKLVGVWKRVSELRSSVMEKRSQLERLKQEQGMGRFVGSQLLLLEKWEKIEKAHTQSTASTFRLMRTLSIEVPLIAGAKADVYSVHRALCTALDVVCKIETTVTRSLVQARKLCCFLSELSEKAKQERMGFAEVTGILRNGLFLLAQENSFRVHLIQAMEREGEYLNDNPITWNSKHLIKKQSIRLRSSYHQHSYIHLQVGADFVCSKSLDSTRITRYIS